MGEKYTGAYLNLRLDLFGDRSLLWLVLVMACRCLCVTRGDGVCQVTPAVSRTIIPIILGTSYHE